MNQELVKVTDLHKPAVSGMVSVPLSELDTLRAEHLRAIKLASDLEEKQKLVKVEIKYGEPYKKAIQDIGFADKPYTRYERAVTWSNEILYINLEEAYDSMRKEIYSEIQESVKKRMHNLRAENSELTTANEGLQENHSTLLETIDELKTSLNMAESSSQDALGKLNVSIRSRERNEKRVTTVEEGIEKLKDENYKLRLKLSDSSLKGIFKKLFSRG